MCRSFWLRVCGFGGFAGVREGGLGIFRNSFFVAVNMTHEDLEREDVLKMVGIGDLSCTTPIYYRS